MTTSFDPYRPAARPRWALPPDAPVAPASPPHPRPEAPHTHLTVRVLSVAERATLRRTSPILAADLDAAERLRSSPMVWLSHGVTAASASGMVDRLRQQARTALGPAATESA
jgi:hypothetical protein